MLAVLIYIIGVILVLIGGIVIMLYSGDDCDIEEESLTVVALSVLSWVVIGVFAIALIILGIHKLVYKLTYYIKTKKGL